MKILILALSGIGDALMFTPALQLLKNNLPEASIDAAVMFAGVRNLYENLSEIDNVFYYDMLHDSKAGSFKFIWSLRKRHYDITINVYPSNRKEYNAISFLIGAKKRAAAAYLRQDFKNLGWLNNIRVTESDNQHNVITNISLIKKLTGKTFKDTPKLIFPLNDSEKHFALNFLSDNNIFEDDFIVGIHAGCATLKNHIKRRWEPEKFAQLASKLITDKNAKILLFGGPEEEELKNQILSQINNKNAFFVKTNTLAESAALISKCKIFITNDSSLMHTASAMQVKTFAIIGPTNENYIHPWQTEYKTISLGLDCAPCFFYSPRPLICNRDDVKFKCIKELSVDYAFNIILDEL